MEVWSSFFNFIKENIWVVHIFLGVLILLGLHFFLKYFAKIMGKKFSWKKEVVDSFLKPGFIIIWLIGIFYVINVFAHFFGSAAVLKYSKIIRDTLIVIIACIFLIKWKTALQSSFFKKISKKIDFATLDFLSKIISFIIVFIALLIILQILGVNIMPLIAFGGVGAAAIGFAAKDVISNFFGGFMIHITRPFSKGDYVEIPKENILGTIEKIGWYLTCIKDLECCPIYLPNSIFSTAQIKNKTRRTSKKIEETISIRYDDFSKISLIISDIEKLLKEEENVEEDPLVVFTSFSAYSLDLMVRVYIKVVSYNDFMLLRQKLFLEIGKIIESHGAEIPFPTNLIKLEKS